jgi:hypothetical protein
MEEIYSTPLSDVQLEIMSRFYSKPAAKVCLSRSERKQIALKFKASRRNIDPKLEQTCPALHHELTKSIKSGKNLQSAVASECVYSQALADTFDLTQFVDYEENIPTLNSRVEAYITHNSLKPRYVYENSSRTTTLIQAGGGGAVDGALLDSGDDKGIAIEFKEPKAKISEPDLPEYGEDGYLKNSEKFMNDYSHFQAMIEEQIRKGLNFWEILGTNVHDFSREAVDVAVSNNYNSNKFADVICVEDSESNLLMIPAKHAGLWAKARGEIRPAGRNNFELWTPQAFESCVKKMGGEIIQGTVKVPLKSIKTAFPRGGTKEVSRYKLNPVFFVRSESTNTFNGQLTFDLESVRQNRPTISVILDFKGINRSAITSFYRIGS